jgi:hypothetical protein
MKTNTLVAYSVPVSKNNGRLDAKSVCPLSLTVAGLRGRDGQQNRVFSLFWPIVRLVLVLPIK